MGVTSLDSKIIIYEKIVKVKTVDIRTKRMLYHKEEMKTLECVLALNDFGLISFNRGTSQLLIVNRNPRENPEGG